MALFLFCSAVAAAAVHVTAALPSNSARQQQRLGKPEIMVETERAGRVYGYNNATYGPVPKEDQLFHVEELDLGPSPIHLYYTASVSREKVKQRG
jgi:hypothetical protein